MSTNDFERFLNSPWYKKVYQVPVVVRIVENEDALPNEKPSFLEVYEDKWNGAKVEEVIEDGETVQKVITPGDPKYFEDLFLLDSIRVGTTTYSVTRDKRNPPELE